MQVWKVRRWRRRRRRREVERGGVESRRARRMVYEVERRFENGLQTKGVCGR